MPELRVTFALAEADLRHFREVMRQAIVATTGRTEQEILQGALKQAREVRGARPPGYVLDRIETLEIITEMVQEKDWVVPGSVRPRVLTALAYFLDPADLIPDHIPGLGFLDDAIMIELIAQELRHEIDGYRDFKRFREKEQLRRRPGDEEVEARLQARRKQLRARVQGRVTRDGDRAGRRFRLW
jgi:uncharacterized membrane protein YkvA (DUF1232 family)